MKILKIIYYIFGGIVGLLAILFVASTLPIAGNIKFMVVQSGSMEPAIKTGGVIMIKPESEYNLEDVVTFLRVGERVPTTHRIVGKKEVNGKMIYETQGDANNAPDKEGVVEAEVMGKVWFSIPYLGYVINFAKQPLGFILLIVVPGILIVSDELKKIHKEIKKKKEEENV
jgi:signal peptidase